MQISFKRGPSLASYLLIIDAPFAAGKFPFSRVRKLPRKSSSVGHKKASSTPLFSVVHLLRFSLDYQPLGWILSLHHPDPESSSGALYHATLTTRYSDKYGKVKSIIPLTRPFVNRLRTLYGVNRLPAGVGAMTPLTLALLLWSRAEDLSERYLESYIYLCSTESRSCLMMGMTLK